MSKSKFGLVFGNSRGTRAKIQYYEYTPGDEVVAPDESLYLIGQVYDHRENGDLNMVPDLPSYQISNIYANFLLTEEAFSDLYGKLMTFADATFVEQTQRKAFKDVMGQQLGAWREKHSTMVKQTYEGSAFRNAKRKGRGEHSINYTEYGDDPNRVGGEAVRSDDSGRIE